MRWLVVVLAGCGFAPTMSSSETGPADAGVDVDAPSGPLAACASNAAYQPRSGSTHLYKRTTDMPQFDDAVEECQQDGAYLVRIDDTIENVYVVTTFGSLWVGASDQTTEGTFRSVYDNQSVPYANFVSPEPNNAGSNEDCVYIKGDGSWNDTPCHENTRKALCECDPVYQAPVVPACRSQPGAKTVESRMYFITSTPATWADAAAHCASTGAYLVVPSDDKENGWVQGNEININADAWLGVSQTGTVWSLADQSPYTYENWNSTPSTTNDCAVIRGNGRWDPVACTETHPYVCECPP